MKSIPYGRQEVTPEDIAAVVETLQSDYLTRGPKGAAFESAFAEYVGAKYAVAVSCGTAALHLSAQALGVTKGDRILVTTMSFAASANCIRYCGGEVEFVDIHPESYTIDLEKVEQKLAQGSYKGIVVVDMGGYPVNLEHLRTLADQYGCWIIEDTSHAPGGTWTNSKGEIERCGNGNYADCATFSFHPVKHIATGEGGMITTNNKALYEKLVLLRTHGITRKPEWLEENHGGWYYEMHELGYNYRMSDIHAALGLSQLKRAESMLEKRRYIIARYNEALKGLPLQLPKVAEGVGHAWHIYIIQTDLRDDLYAYLKSKGIHVQVHYIPIHLAPYYKKQGWNWGDFPIAESYYRRCLSLPVFPSLTEAGQAYVIEHIHAFFDSITSLSTNQEILGKVK